MSSQDPLKEAQVLEAFIGCLRAPEVGPTAVPTVVYIGHIAPNYNYGREMWHRWDDIFLPPPPPQSEEEEVLAIAEKIGTVLYHTGARRSKAAKSKVYWSDEGKKRGLPEDSSYYMFITLSCRREARALIKAIGSEKWEQDFDYSNNSVRGIDIPLRYAELSHQHC